MPKRSKIPAHIRFQFRTLLVVVFYFFLSSSIFSKGNFLERTWDIFQCQLAFPQATVSGVNTIYIPFQMAGQLIMVEADIDTFSGLFMFDTGAERLVLNKQYFKPDPKGKSVTAAGNTGWIMDAVEEEVDSIRIERLVIRELDAHIVDLHHIALKKNIRLMGILGYNVFQGFEVFIDFQNRVIVLHRVDQTGRRLAADVPWELPADSLDFELKKHFIVVEAKVNEVNLKMILDSGAELNLIDRNVNRKVLDRFTVIKRVNLVGAGHKEVEVLAGVLREVHCHNQYTEKMNTLLTDLDEMNYSFGIRVQGVLGYEFLKNRRVLINYKKEKLYFFNPVRS